MWIVAIAELATPIEVEAAALAIDLGVVPYEARMKIGGGLPAILLTTADATRARDLAARIRARRHGVVACEDESVVSADDMISMRRFRFDGAEVIADDRGDERLLVDDVFALLRASHSVKTQTTVQTKEKQLSVGRAVMTGGLVMTRKVGRDQVTHTTEREHVLYIFRRSGRPWILREHGTYYQGLGDKMGISQHENFNRTLQLLRETMPSATYDDRLLHIKRVPERSSRSTSKTEATSNADGMDLLAHVHATWLYERSQSRPYRM